MNKGNFIFRFALIVAGSVFMSLFLLGIAFLLQFAIVHDQNKEIETKEKKEQHSLKEENQCDTLRNKERKRK